jgi:choline-sulfatase
MDIKKPSRRQFLQGTGALAAAGVLGLAGGGEEAEAQTPRGPRTSRSTRTTTPSGPPNFLFFLVDEMRYPPIYENQPLKDFRNQYLRTQNALKAHGVEFHRHYTASMACAPSRTSLFTGHYPSVHGVTNTNGAAKEANDPEMFWLDPDSVPTMGDYFRAGGYRTFYKGKWHVSLADLVVPGVHANSGIPSYDNMGNRDPAAEQLYLDAERLDGYGFSGWIGPEPHGKNPLNSASSPATGKGRDQGYASQAVELLQQLDASSDNTPWFTVVSLVNPHDIALWGFVSRATGLFDFSVDADIPTFFDLFDATMFGQTIADDLTTKPSAQKSYRDSYNLWMQGVPPVNYWRLYYQLHREVDNELYKVYDQLKKTRFFDNTIVTFTSDHGDLLGAHGYMHQKWYVAYDEPLRIPMIFSNEKMFPTPKSVDSLTSHVDLLPTLLGLAGLDANALRPLVAEEHTDAIPVVGRNLASLVKGQVSSVADPIFFMTDDDPSRGLDQENVFGVAYDSVIQPNHLETVIAEVSGKIWKYTRYFDNPQFWSDTQPLFPILPIKDEVTHVDDALVSNIPGEHAVDATVRVKLQPVTPEEFEMYNVTDDPMELNNLIGQGNPMESYMSNLLDQQRTQKRLHPISGTVPEQP